MVVKLFKQILKAIKTSANRLSKNGKIALRIYSLIYLIAFVLELAGVYMISTGLQAWINGQNTSILKNSNETINFFVLGATSFLCRSLILLLANLKVLRHFIDEEVLIADDNFENWQAQPLHVRQNTDPSFLPIVVQETPNIQLQLILIKSVSVFTETMSAAFLFIVIGIFNPFISIGSLIFYTTIGYFQHHFISSASSKVGQHRINSLTKVYDFLDIAHRLTAVLQVMPSRSFKSNLLQSRKISAKALMDTQVLQLLPRLTLDLSLFIGIAFVVGISNFFDPSSQSEKAVGLFLILSARLAPILSSLQAQISQIMTFLPFLEHDLKHTIPANSANYVEQSDHENSPECIYPITGRSQIILENVSFEYPNSLKPALSDISLKLERGLIYVVVGSNGSGKSTLINLVAGLLAPTKGTIISNELELVIGYVPQTTVLFNGSVAQNIAIEWDSENINFDKISEIYGSLQEIDQIKTDLSSHPASDLSGGQQQLLNLIRALYREPNLLLLDEANSFFDHKTESIFDKLIHQDKKNRVTILISHRTYSILNSDVIILMDSGKLVDLGTLTEIRKRQPAFETLITPDEPSK